MYFVHRILSVPDSVRPVLLFRPVPLRPAFRHQGRFRPVPDHLVVRHPVFLHPVLLRPAFQVAYSDLCFLLYLLRSIRLCALITAACQNTASGKHCDCPKAPFSHGHFSSSSHLLSVFIIAGKL